MTEIEKRVASAYSGLRPRAGLADEIASQLTSERARPRRVGPYVLALAAVLLIALGFAFKRGGGGGASTLADAGPTPSSVEVRVTADGRVLIKLPVLDGKWAQVSLDGLATHLRKSADAHGKFTELRPGVKVSDLKVVIHPAPNTPWRHVQWIMTVCAEQKLPKLELRTTKGVKLPVPLPVDPAIGAERKRTIKISIHIMRRGNNRVAYRFGDRQSDDPRDAAKWIYDAKQAVAKANNLIVVGEVKAGHTVPHRAITLVLIEFARVGVDRVQFFGTAIPKEAERRALQLPMPKGSRPRVGSSALPVPKEETEEDIEDDG